MTVLETNTAVDVALARNTRPPVMEAAKAVDANDARARLTDLGAMLQAIVNRAKRNGRAVLHPNDVQDIEAVFAVYDGRLNP